MIRLPVWMVTRALTSADSASCHAQQVHTNMTHTVALLGTPQPMSQLLLCAVDCEGTGVKVQPRWRDQATGMRATVSHQVDFDRVFVADDAVIGPPGSYWTSQVQARYLPQFSSNFQGVGAHLFDYAVNYLRERRRTSDPYIQHHLAEAKVMLVTAELLLGETAQLYRTRRYPEAFDHSRMLRAYSQMAVQRVIDLIQAACGLVDLYGAEPDIPHHARLAILFSS